MTQPTDIFWKFWLDKKQKNNFQILLCYYEVFLPFFFTFVSVSALMYIVPILSIWKEKKLTSWNDRIVRLFIVHYEFGWNRFSTIQMSGI
jgi:hypothetical protein